jgi:protein tyrosine phosphatase
MYLSLPSSPQTSSSDRRSSSEPAKVDFTQELWERLQKQTREHAFDYLPGKDFDRFLNISCVKATAVKIGDRALHANRVGQEIVNRDLVALQAPIEGHFEIFWTAVFASGAAIFDLTSDADKQGLKPCYYPENMDETKTYGNISVKLINTETKENISVHTYEIEDTTTGTKKEIKRHNFLGWLDHGVVGVKELAKLVEKANEASDGGKKPLWIHCRAGAGRTGSLTTAIILKEKIASDQIGLLNLDTVLQGIIFQLRTQRGADFVQTDKQLGLLRDYATYLIQRRTKFENCNFYYRKIDRNEAEAVLKQAEIPVGAAILRKGSTSPYCVSWKDSADTVKHFQLTDDYSLEDIEKVKTSEGGPLVLTKDHIATELRPFSPSNPEPRPASVSPAAPAPSNLSRPDLDTSEYYYGPATSADMSFLEGNQFEAGDALLRFNQAKRNYCLSWKEKVGEQPVQHTVVGFDYPLDKIRDHKSASGLKTKLLTKAEIELRKTRQ